MIKGTGGVPHSALSSQVRAIVSATSMRLYLLSRHQCGSSVGLLHHLPAPAGRSLKCQRARERETGISERPEQYSHAETPVRRHSLPPCRP